MSEQAPEIKLETPEVHVKTHRFGDLDLTPRSEHHTIGKGPNQAAAGNHNHSDLNAEIVAIKARLTAGGL